MQQQNLHEYEFIRKEMKELKTCITTYTGFVLGGSIVALLGSSLILKEGKSNIIINIYFFIASIIVSIVLKILFYKFNSHNRHSGYCKLLNQEDISYSGTATQLFSWEICLAKLREFDEKYNKKDSDPQPNSITFKQQLEENIELVKDNELCTDYDKKIKQIYTRESGLYRALYGFKLVLETYINIAKVRSWAFPLYITAAFLTINIFLISMGYFKPIDLQNTEWTNSYFTLNMALGVTLFVQTIMWYHLLKRLYDLTMGIRTIESYCLKFLPFRCRYVNSVLSAYITEYSKKKANHQNQKKYKGRTYYRLVKI